MTENKIVSLSQIIENKVVKERELAYYYEQLSEIQRKIAFLETDLNLTKTIIKMIEKDSIIKIDASVPIIGNDSSL